MRLWLARQDSGELVQDVQPAIYDVVLTEAA